MNDCWLTTTHSLQGQVPAALDLCRQVTKTNIPENDLQKMRETVMATISKESDHSNDKDATPAADAVESPPQEQAKQKGLRGSYDAPAQVHRVAM